MFFQNFILINAANVKKYEFLYEVLRLVLKFCWLGFYKEAAEINLLIMKLKKILDGTADMFASEEKIAEIQNSPEAIKKLQKENDRYKPT